MRLGDRVLKEMVTNLDAVQRRLRDDIYRDLEGKELKLEFQCMTSNELLTYIERRLGELNPPNPAPRR